MRLEGARPLTPLPGRDDERPEFDPFTIVGDDVLVCFDALRDLKHNITIAPIIRFFDEAQRTLGEERSKRLADLKDAIRATAAFSMLWRAAKGGTENIDSHYREIMRAGVQSESIAPLAKRTKDKKNNVTLNTIFLDGYKRALRYYLEKEGFFLDKNSWVKAAAQVPIYQHSKVVARFMLFCATDDAVVDEKAPGLIKRGVPNRAPLFKLENWQKESYYTVEHIAPSSPENWSATFYEDARLIHCLGNLILLPQEANALIGNRPWAHKKLFYKLLSADTVEQQDTIKAELLSIGVRLSKTGEDIIKTADYNQTCRAIASVSGDWSVELINDRSKRIAELTWDKLIPWLQPAGS